MEAVDEPRVLFGDPTVSCSLSPQRTRTFHPIRVRVRVKVKVEVRLRLTSQPP